MKQQDLRVRAQALLSMVLAGALLLSCSDNNDGNAIDLLKDKIGGESDDTRLSLRSVTLNQANDCDELKSYIVSSIVERNTNLSPYFFRCPIYTTDPRIGGVGGGTALAGSADAAVEGGTAAPAPALDANPDSVTGTNNQEVDVNEADIVKTDAQGNMYVISGSHLIITDAFPPQNLGSEQNPPVELDLGSRALDMFLDESSRRLIVITQLAQPYPILFDTAVDAVSIAPVMVENAFMAIFFDVSTPLAPTEISRLKIKGNYQDARRIDQRVHLVSSYYYSPDFIYGKSETNNFWTLRQAYWDAVYKTRDTLCSENLETGALQISEHPDVVAAKAGFSAEVARLFENVSPEDYLPTASASVAGGELAPKPFLACSDISFPGIEADLGLRVLTSVDSDGANMQAAAVVNNAGRVYASKNNLYLSETSRHWWRPVNSALPVEQTAIYKFAISNGKPRYLATGTVDGFAQRQFNFSEHNGDLRVATTTTTRTPGFITGGISIAPQPPVRTNNVFVLRDNNQGQLRTIGEVRGYGEGESIFSTRFYGDKGYVVTFLQIDPLFTFDLSDPENPRLVGELVMPGFSDYIQRYDDNHLLTIGRTGGEGGRGTGNNIKLQLIDVSDMANPKVKHELEPALPDSSWSWSEAAYDHMAFTFDYATNYLAIPLNYSSSTGHFNGIATFKLMLDNAGNPDRFVEVGRVDHSDLARQFYCILADASLYPCVDGSYIHWANPRRSVFMAYQDATYLYTVSDTGLKASDMANVAGPALGSILFPAQVYPWFYFWDMAEPVGVTDGPMIF